MTIKLIFRIAAVGILVSVLGQVLKHSGRDEQAFLVSLAGLILVLLWVIPYIAELFETIQNYLHFSAPYLKFLCKYGEYLYKVFDTEYQSDAMRRLYCMGGGY